MTRVPTNAAPRRLGLAAMISLSWILAGACASEGEPSATSSSLDAAVEAAEVDAGASTSTRDASDTTDAKNAPSGCSDDGWCVVDAPMVEGLSLSAIWGSGPSDVWVVGSAGSILHFDGAAWALLPKGDAGTAQTLFTVWGSGPSDVWAASTERVLFHSDGWHGGGAKFDLVRGSDAWRKRLDDVEQAQPQGKFRVWNLWGSGPNDLWMAPSDSIRCWHASGYAAGDVDWIPVLDYFPSSDPDFFGIWGSAANDVWLVGSQGKILHTVSGFQNGLVDWEILNSGTSQDLNGVWGSAYDDVWAVGRIGTIRHWGYDLGGELAWLPSDSGVDAELHAVWGTSPRNVWAVGDESTILHGDGDGWAVARLPALERSVTFRGVWGSAEDDVWVVGDGVLLHRGRAQGQK